MKQVFQIFKHDLKAVFTNIWALIIVVGIMFIPALYAWFNINSNWDPYSATSGMKIAVANSDEGAKVEGIDVNIGSMIVEKLAENHAIGWQFVSEEEALKGVDDGSYYAAVVIPDNFSSSVGSIAELVIEKPQILYYVNEKKNAIAPKITNTGVNTIQLQVNQAIVQTATSVLSSLSQSTMNSFETKGADALDQITDSLHSIQDSVQEYQSLVSAVNSAAGSLNSSMDAASSMLPAADDALKKASETSQNAKALLEDTHSTALILNSTLESSLKTAENMTRTLKNMTDDTMDYIDPRAQSASSGAQSQLSTLSGNISTLQNYNHSLLDALSTLNDATHGKLSVLSKLTDKLDDREDQMNEMQSKISDMQDTISQGQSLASAQKRELKSMARDLDESSSDLKSVFRDDVKPQVEKIYDAMDSALGDLSEISTDTTLSSSLQNSIGSMQDALTSSQDALDQTADLLSQLDDKIQGYIDEIEQAKKDEKILKVEELLTRDPELVAAFMKEPVSIQTVSVYPIANYGSGMAPFYTTLAIWVGALVNCAILKTKVKSKKADGSCYSPNEEYFGRYMFFAMVSVCQALIICLGDLWLMKIQCLHPFLFCFMGVVTALNFSLLMYTLTVSFGDVGKAIAVILMVIQVAGSGGTFPIDVLPKFYQILYPFYPFNYAINGMRECIGGIWQNAYWIDVFKELLFVPVSLLIGLFLRKPIIRMKEYIEEHVEKTGFVG